MRQPAHRVDTLAYTPPTKPAGSAVSAISVLGVAKLVEVGRLALPKPALDWMDLRYGYQACSSSA